MRPIDFNEDLAVNPIDLPCLYKRSAFFAVFNRRKGLFETLRVDQANRL